MRTPEELEGEMRHVIMQKAWLRKMADERIRDLNRWHRDLQSEMKKNHPSHQSTVPEVEK